MSYIEMVEVLLNLTRASREGNWLLYLASIRDIITWVFAYDHTNYARYLHNEYDKFGTISPRYMSLFKQWWFFRSIVFRKPIWKGSDGPNVRRNDKLGHTSPV